MSNSSILNNLRGLAKAALAAGALLLGLTASGAQAAVVTVYSGNANEAAWEAAAGGGPFKEENFDDAVLIPQLVITFGTALPGNISGGKYNDRASDDVPQANNPLLTFTGLGARAFGADFDLGPNDPGTGLQLLITFADLSTLLLPEQILNPFVNEFFGIVSDMAIRSIRFIEANQPAVFETFSMDNVRIAPVPIPAALPLFLSALAALGFLGRRRKRLATA
jgi:hypothetical protein